MLLWKKLHQIGDKLKIPDLPNWLLGLLVLVFVLRIPSFFEPYYYGDEMIYLTLGQGVRQGLTLYKDIHDNKPPLLYLVAAVAGSLFWFKVLLAAASIAAIIVFWKLAAHLFSKNKKTVIAATFVFGLLTTLPTLEGNIVNAEAFMVFTTLLAFYIALTKKLTAKNLYLSGVLLGLSVLFKVPSIFDIPVLVLFWFFTNNFKDWKKVLKNTLYLSYGILTPIVATFIWYALRGALKDYIVAAFLQNVGYLSSWRGANKTSIPFLVKNGPLLIRFGIVVLGSAILFWRRKKLSSKFILICLWTLFSLFAVTLSERPYPHYLIQSVPAIALLVGMLLTDEGLEQALSIIPLTLIFLVPSFYHFWYYPTSIYYQRFANFSLTRITKDQYFHLFSKNAMRNYQIADFINKSSQESDRVFVWDTDAPTIYALSRRVPPIKYVADYHVKDYWNQEDMVQAVIASRPKFVVLTDDSPIYGIQGFLNSDYLLVKRIDTAEIWTRMNGSSE